MNLLRNVPSLRSQIMNDIDPPPGVPKEWEDFISMLSTVFTLAYVFAAVVSVAFIIISGYLIMTGGGDPQKMKKGTDTLMFAIAGLVLVLISGIIFNFVANLLGVENLITVFPTI